MDDTKPYLMRLVRTYGIKRRVPINEKSAKNKFQYFKGFSNLKGFRFSIILGPKYMKNAYIMQIVCAR
uniref:Uncharacterized protein n=1 Tax=Cryptosporidium parvum TaxID=5807 RepID=F0X639_CRYPV